MKLLRNEDITMASKTQSKVNWEEGYVSISDINIRIKSNSFTKRTKIIDNNIWVDTQPNIIKRSYHTKRFKQYINYFDTSLVVYKTKITSLVLYDKQTKRNGFHNFFI